MNFNTHQDNARQKTTCLVFLFVLGIIGFCLTFHIIAALLLATAATDGFMYDWQEVALDFLINQDLATCTIIPLFTIILLASVGMMVFLRKDGAGIAKTLGGSEVSNPPRRPHEQRLWNAVHDMALNRIYT